MNNKIFVASFGHGDDKEGYLRSLLGSVSFYDKYGSYEVAVRSGRFGFEPVFPSSSCRFSLLFRMLGCSYVYIPSGWRCDPVGRFAFAFAEIFCKKVIFGEDWRCR